MAENLKRLAETIAGMQTQDYEAGAARVVKSNEQMVQSGGRVEASHTKFGRTHKVTSAEINDSLGAQEIAVSATVVAWEALERVAAAVGITLSAAGLVAFAGHVQSGVVALRSQAQQLGTTAAALQVYNYAALATGTSTDQFASAFGALNKKIAEAVAAQPEAIGQFKALGIGVLDSTGKARTGDAVWRDFSDSIRGVADPAKRTSLAVGLIGDSARQVMPLLVQGSAGLSDYERAARQLGLVLDDSLIKRFADAGAKMDVLKARFTAFAANLIDTITNNPVLAALAGGGLVGLATLGLTRSPVLAAGAAGAAGAGIFDFMTPKSDDDAAISALHQRYIEIQKIADDIDKLREKIAANTAKFRENDAAFPGMDVGGLYVQVAKEQIQLEQQLALLRQKGDEYIRIDNARMRAASAERRLAREPIPAEMQVLSQLNSLNREPQSNPVPKNITDRIAALKEEFDAQRQLDEALRNNNADYETLRDRLSALKIVRDLNADATSKEGQQIIALVSAIESEKRAIAERTKAEDELQRDIEHSTNRLVDFAGREIFDVLTGRAKSFWESFRDFGARTFSQLAAEAVIRPIVQPLVAATVMGAAGMFGMGQAQAGTGGGGYLNNASSALSIGRYFGGDLGGLIGTAGAAAPIVSTSASLAIQGSALETLVAQPVAGTGILGALGPAAGALPYIGAALAVAALAYSIWGGPKPSVGPNGGAVVNVNNAGAAISATQSDNGFNPAAMSSQMLQVGQAFANAVKALDGEVDRNVKISVSQIQNHFDYWADAAGSAISGSAASFQEAASAAVAWVLHSGAITGLSENLNTVIRHSTGDLQTLLSDVSFVKGLEDAATGLSGVAAQMKALSDSADAARDHLTSLGLTTELADKVLAKDTAAIVKATNDNIGDAILSLTDPFALQRVQEGRLHDQTAKDLEALNISLEGENRRHSLVMQKIQDDQNAGVEQSARQSASDLVNTSRRVSDAALSLALGGDSSLSTQQKLQLAGQEFFMQSQIALSGDATDAVRGAAASQAASIGATYTRLGRDYYASGEGSVTVFNTVEGVLARIARQVDPQSTVQAINAGIMQQAHDSADVKALLRQILGVMGETNALTAEQRNRNATLAAGVDPGLPRVAL